MAVMLTERNEVRAGARRHSSQIEKGPRRHFICFRSFERKKKIKINIPAFMGSVKNSPAVITTNHTQCIAHFSFCRLTSEGHSNHV